MQEYHHAIEFLSSLVDYERWVHRDYEFKLDNYLAFLEKIGNPHKRLNRVVLVAGTKGKGSTATMLASVLETHGEKVGLYTSPHLIDYRERIKINGRNIPASRFASLIDDLKPAILEHEPRITFFEALTSLAFLYFLEERNTVNVLEIGMGGRLDATNVTYPELSVITCIGYDHTQMLGKTLDKIASEKCGILRPDKYAVIAAQRPRARQAIAEAICKKRAKGFWWQKDFRAKLVAEDTNGLKMHYSGLKLDAEFRIPVLGIHQIENAAAAVASAELMLSKPDKKTIGEALASLQLKGRIEIVGKSPLIILDMSHNRESAATLRKTLEEHFRNHTCKILLIGITKQKERSKILRILAPFFTEVWVTEANTPRATPGELLLKLCNKIHPCCRIARSVKEGIEGILARLPADGLLVISGSVYVAGEALEALKARKGSDIKGSN